MNAIVKNSRNKKEETFLKEFLKNMNVETHIVNEPVPNNETIWAIEDVEKKKGTHVKDSGELFSNRSVYDIYYLMFQSVHINKYHE